MKNENSATYITIEYNFRIDRSYSEEKCINISSICTDVPEKKNQ